MDACLIAFAAVFIAGALVVGGFSLLGLGVSAGTAAEKKAQAEADALKLGSD